MTVRTVFWVSRHKLTQEQEGALKDIYPEAVVVHHNETNLDGIHGLSKYIRGVNAVHGDAATVFAVAPVEQMIHAHAEGLDFGFFTMKSREDRSQGFVLDKVYYVYGTSIEYANPGGPVAIWPRK